MKIVYALKEINTGLFYSQKHKDIVELGLDIQFFDNNLDAKLVISNPISLGMHQPLWFATLSAIERMYDKPILEIDELNEDMIKDTASLFKFKIVPIAIMEW